MLAFLSITILFIYITGSLKFTNFHHAKSVTYNLLYIMDDLSGDGSSSCKGFVFTSPSADYSGEPLVYRGRDVIHESFALCRLDVCRN